MISPAILVDALGVAPLMPKIERRFPHQSSHGKHGRTMFEGLLFCVPPDVAGRAYRAGRYEDVQDVRLLEARYRFLQ